MASTYAQFLKSPNTSLLAPNASIHYITTAVSIHEPTAILKHLQAQLKQLVTKESEVLSSIEQQNGLCLETNTTLLFKSGGGAYLPSIDENLLDEKMVTFPLVHIVTFDAEQKIHQVRLYWDQGTLLKQVEAIGKTGRNWPIKDGPAQVDVIHKSVRESGKTQGATNGITSLPTKGPIDVVINQHKKRERVSATGDPHASLSLFERRDPNEDAEPRAFDGPKVAPRASAKPASRGFDEILGDEAKPTPGSQLRSPSPTKADGVMFKSGAGKHHIHNRLFSENENPADPHSPERRKKTYGQKYDHFAFGDGENVQQSKPPSDGRLGKGHQQSFSFEDFSTPPKFKEKQRPDDERHWGAGVEEDAPPSPPKRPVVHHARPDADQHFTLTDAEPAPEKTKSLQREKGTALYRNDLFTTEQEQNVNTSTANKARSDTEAHWKFGTPDPQRRKIYKTAGDGMGSRTAVGGRSWGIGDESDPEVDADVRSSARSRKAFDQTEAGAEQ